MPRAALSAPIGRDCIALPPAFFGLAPQDSSAAALKQAYWTQKEMRQEETEDHERRLANFDEDSEVARFLLSKALQGCSLILCLAPAAPPGDGAAPGNEGVIEGPDGQRWRFRINIFDLHEQTPQDIRRFYDEDRAACERYLAAAQLDGVAAELVSEAAERAAAAAARRESAVASPAAAAAEADGGAAPRDDGAA